MDGNLSWLAGAFTIGWAIIFVYLYRIAGREREVRRRVAALEDLLKDR